jgi:hypothetical protein
VSASPRFLLILSVHSSTLRASLVTRELRIVSSAHQSFQVTANTFDPLEVWYKTKKVIAACFDIGRTLSREIAGIVLLTSGGEHVSWSQTDAQTIAGGTFSPAPANTMDAGAQTHSGTLADWLLWNLSGGSSNSDASLGRTYVRAPFDAALPILTSLTEQQVAAQATTEQGTNPNATILRAAQIGWENLETRTKSREMQS